jgi:hypothetical protein
VNITESRPQKGQGTGTRRELPVVPQPGDSGRTQSSRIVRVREVTNKVFRQGRLTMSADIGRQRTHTRTHAWRRRSGSSLDVVPQVHRHHFPPSRRQRRRKPATILLVQPIRRVSPYKSHRVMQYNTWKRVSPSNPMSSHPARSASPSLTLSLYIHPAIAATIVSPKP